MQSGGWTERCDGKSGVCRMRTRERRSSWEAYRHRRWSGADDGGDAGRCRARGSGAETKRSSWWAVGRGGSLVRTEYARGWAFLKRSGLQGLRFVK
jgi:hypothetical protein